MGTLLSLSRPLRTDNVLAKRRRAAYGGTSAQEDLPYAARCHEALGALGVVAINYFVVGRSARRRLAEGCECGDLRRAMIVTAALGIAAMAGTFILLEWLNHAVINSHRFLAQPEYGQALIPGVPNVRLAYAAVTFLGIAVLWAIPWTGASRETRCSRSSPGYGAGGRCGAAAASRRRCSRYWAPHARRRHSP